AGLLGFVGLLVLRDRCRELGVELLILRRSWRERVAVSLENLNPRGALTELAGELILLELQACAELDTVPRARKYLGVVDDFVRRRRLGLNRAAGVCRVDRYALRQGRVGNRHADALDLRRGEDLLDEEGRRGADDK